MSAKIPAHVRVEQINNLPNITFVRWNGEYIGNRTKAVVKCDIDGNEWAVAVTNILDHRSGCPLCSGVKRCNSSERQTHINNLPNITFIRWEKEFKNNRSKAIVRCDVDGYEWSARVANLVNGGYGCPECANLRRLTEYDTVDKINARENIDFVKWVDGYVNSRSRCVVKCRLDGFEWETTAFAATNSKTGCHVCAGQRRRTGDERIAEIDNLGNVKFIRWYSKYTNQQSKVIVRCQTDGFEWCTTVNRLVNQGCGCPKCAVYGYNPAKQGTLYALRSKCGTMIKIGISNNYKRRLRELTKSTPFDWDCVELIHGDGNFVASIERSAHKLTEPAIADGQFDGYTEWRKWVPEITNWFNTWKSLTPKGNGNV